MCLLNYLNQILHFPLVLRTNAVALATSELEIMRYCDQLHILSYHKLWIADYIGRAV
jgi:hypothetical protein